MFSYDYIITAAGREHCVPLKIFRGLNIAGLALAVLCQGPAFPWQNPETNKSSVSGAPPPAARSAGDTAGTVQQPQDENGPEKSPEKRSSSGYILRKLKEWRDAVLDHAAGEADAAAVEIGGWDYEDVEIVIDFLAKLASRSRKSIRKNIAKAPIRSRLRLTKEEVQNGDLNRILKQGALLHTDIALLNLEKGKSSDKRNLISAYVDGRVILMPKKLHLSYARTLINSVSPSASEDAMARQWYVATTAEVQSIRHLAFARENIEAALKLFSDDSTILLYAGALHETWASPSNQNTQLPMRRSAVYESKKEELKKARKFYRKAIESDPDMSEAYLRLGRVSGLLGSHREAIDALQKAGSGIDDPKLTYYVSLFLGREFEMVSRYEQARARYEEAARLFPAAQSPLLSLSQLSHRSSDTESAMSAIQRVFALPHQDPVKDDPLWTYDLSHVENAAMLIEEMHRTFGELPK